MNVRDAHAAGKEVSASAIFKSDNSVATAIRILSGCRLKEHLTKVPAMLICIDGEAAFENEAGLKTKLFPGDYVLIEPMIKHWVDGITQTDLLLVK